MSMSNPNPCDAFQRKGDTTDCANCGFGKYEHHPTRAEIHNVERRQGRRIQGGVKMAAVIRTGVLDMQVCVPSDWTDEQVKQFADTRNDCGTTHGWHVRKDGDPLLAGQSSRVVCDANTQYVHIMLDA